MARSCDSESVAAAIVAEVGRNPGRSLSGAVVALDIIESADCDPSSSRLSKACAETLTLASSTSKLAIDRLIGLP